MLPGLVIVLGIAAIALGESPPLWIRAVGAGAAAAVVAVVVQAGVVLGRTSVRGVRAGVYVVIGAAAVVLLGPGVVAVLLACGFAELGWRRLTVQAWPVIVAAAATLPALAWTALKVGALSYGGGFVIIPLMRADAVDTHGWMTGTEFANAVAYGQLTPGPVVHTVAIVGWAAAGFGGALLAAAIAFAPSFLVIIVLGDRFASLRGVRPRARVPRRRRPGGGRRDPRRRRAAARRARGAVAVRRAGCRRGRVVAAARPVLGAGRRCRRRPRRRGLGAAVP